MKEETLMEVGCVTEFDRKTIKGVKVVDIYEKDSALTAFHAWSVYTARRNKGHVFVTLYPNEIEVVVYKWGEDEPPLKITIPWDLTSVNISKKEEGDINELE